MLSLFLCVSLWSIFIRKYACFSMRQFWCHWREFSRINAFGFSNNCNDSIKPFRAHAHDLYPKCYILIVYKDIFLFFIVSIIVRMSLYDYRLLRVLRNVIFWCIFPKWVLWSTQRNQLGKSIREFFCWISRDIVLSLLNLPIENNKIKIVMQIVLTKGK